MTNMKAADPSRIHDFLCLAGTALHGMNGQDDEIMMDILRDAAHGAINEGLYWVETAGIAGMNAADTAKVLSAFRVARTAIAKFQGEDDEIMQQTLRDAAHAAVSDGLDVFEVASIAA